MAVWLKSQNIEMYYFRDDNSHEVDFVIPQKKLLIQVCLELNEGNRKREMNNLVLASEKLHFTECYILTLAQEETLTKRGKKLQVFPYGNLFLDSYESISGE